MDIQVRTDIERATRYIISPLRLVSGSRGFGPWVSLPDRVSLGKFSSNRVAGQLVGMVGAGGRPLVSRGAAWYWATRSGGWKNRPELTSNVLPSSRLESLPNVVPPPLTPAFSLRDFTAAPTLPFRTPFRFIGYVRTSRGMVDALLCYFRRSYIYRKTSLYAWYDSTDIRDDFLAFFPLSLSDWELRSSS